MSANGPYGDRPDLFRVMIEELDDEKRAELRRQYIECLHANAKAAVARIRRGSNGQDHG